MVEKILISIILMLAGLAFQAQQDHDVLTNSIRQQFLGIRESLDLSDTIMMNVSDRSSEGGQAIFHFADSELKMIELALYGEFGRNNIEYYLVDDKLIFVLDQRFTYNRPIYWDKATAFENGDTEVFDPEKSVESENRYYFEEEVLFLWLNSDNEAVDLSVEMNAQIGVGLVEDCVNLESKLEQLRH